MPPCGTNARSNISNGTERIMTQKKWSQDITEHSNALDLDQGARRAGGDAGLVLVERAVIALGGDAAELRLAARALARKPTSSPRSTAARAEAISASCRSPWRADCLFTP